MILQPLLESSIRWSQDGPLTLIGRELQERWCVINTATWPLKLKYDEEHFSNLATEARNKLAVLMFDEVQNNMNRKHLHQLLEDNSVNLLVLDVGVFTTNGFSSQLDAKHLLENEVSLMYIILRWCYRSIHSFHREKIFVSRKPKLEIVSYFWTSQIRLLLWEKYTMLRRLGMRKWSDTGKCKYCQPFVQFCR